MSVSPAPLIHASVEVDGATGNTVADSGYGVASTSRTGAGVYLVTMFARMPASAVDVELALLTATLGLVSAVEVVTAFQVRVRVQNQAGAATDASFSLTFARRTLGLPA